MKKKPDTMTAMLCLFFIALVVSSFSSMTRSADQSYGKISNAKVPSLAPSSSAKQTSHE